MERVGYETIAIYAQTGTHLYDSNSRGREDDGEHFHIWKFVACTFFSLFAVADGPRAIGRVSE